MATDDESARREEQTVARLDAIAHPTRLEIFRLLADERPRTVSEIANALFPEKLSNSKRTACFCQVSNHLGLMRSAGLVSSKRAGRNAVYSLVPGVKRPDGRFNFGSVILTI